MDEHKAEAEVAQEDLEKVVGGSSSGTALGAGAVAVPTASGGTLGSATSAIMKTVSDTHSDILANLKD